MKLSADVNWLSVELYRSLREAVRAAGHVVDRRGPSSLPPPETPEELAVELAAILAESRRDVGSAWNHPTPLLLDRLLARLVGVPEGVPACVVYHAALVLFAPVAEATGDRVSTVMSVLSCALSLGLYNPSAVVS